MPARNTEEMSMAALVTSGKKTVVTEGVVKQEKEQSLSTLGEKASPLTGKPPSKAAPKRASKEQPEDALGADTEAPDKGGARHRRLSPRTLKDAFARQAAYELDQSDELEGTSDLYGAADAAQHVSKRHKAKRTVTQDQEKAARKGVSKKTKKASGAQGASKKGAASSKAAQASKAAAVQANTAGTSATTAAATQTKAAIGAIGGSGAAAVGGILCAVVAFILCALVIGQIVSALFGFWENEANKATLEGLPPYITYEMVEEALACQEEYGHPAGCTIAQIICESGQGETMSQLATRDHNLFGMKWAASFASAPEVAGKSGWSTNEEYTPGQITTITAYFTVFKGDVECIRFRSRVFLQASHYKYNELIQAAIAEHSSDKMAEGLKDAGWATSSVYVDSLKSAMDAYGLRRFDSMSVDDFRSGGLSGDAIVAAAQSQLGVPYVWGGTTPGVGLDCSGLTQYCYARAGISIPRNSEDQYRAGTKVPVSQASVGDVLYRPGHVAIYIGDDKYIHEPHSGSVCSIGRGASGFTCALKFR